VNQYYIQNKMVDVYDYHLGQHVPPVVLNAPTLPNLTLQCQMAIVDGTRLYVLAYFYRHLQLVGPVGWWVLHERVDDGHDLCGLRIPAECNDITHLQLGCLMHMGIGVNATTPAHGFESILNTWCIPL